MPAHYSLRSLPLLALASFILAPAVLPATSTHRIRFKFAYDFRITPPCSPTRKQACVQQFNFYEISQGVAKRVKLGSMPVPPGATGFMKRLAAETEPFEFYPGKHVVAVSAQMPNGSESDLNKCFTLIKIK